MLDDLWCCSDSRGAHVGIFANEERFFVWGCFRIIATWREKTCWPRFEGRRKPLALCRLFARKYTRQLLAWRSIRRVWLNRDWSDRCSTLTKFISFVYRAPAINQISLRRAGAISAIAEFTKFSKLSNRARSCIYVLCSKNERREKERGERWEKSSYGFITQRGTYEHVVLAGNPLAAYRSIPR